MKYDYDIICIGLGPAGMAVSVMAAEMGLNVCAVEKNKIGGECMNVGCIPSKSLLEIAKLNTAARKLSQIGLIKKLNYEVLPPFEKIQGYLKYISDTKTGKMLKKVNLILGEGEAGFVDSHTIKVKDRNITAKKIFIAVGTEPMVPPVPGIESIDYLTNKNIFNISQIPKSMAILGGGAIGCEMAQAFSRLGTKCTIVHMDGFLIPTGDPEAGALLEKKFEEENIDVHNSKKITKVEKQNGNVVLHIEGGITVSSEKLLLAAGRKINLSGLNLEAAGVKYGKRGIEVDSALRTSQKDIYAVGDCNGGIMLSHAAMHQGMLAIINSLMPFYRFKHKKYVIPWTVFTEPEVSYAGMTEKELKAENIKYGTYVVKYEDYGSAIAKNIGVGYLKVFASAFGKIYGVSIIGERSGEMINEWALAIQKNIKMYDIMFLAHSFPAMGFLTKRVSEIWMMEKTKSKFLKQICRFLFRIF